MDNETAVILLVIVLLILYLANPPGELYTSAPRSAAGEVRDSFMKILKWFGQGMHPAVQARIVVQYYQQRSTAPKPTCRRAAAAQKYLVPLSPDRRLSEVIVRLIPDAVQIARMDPTDFKDFRFRHDLPIFNECID
jgi:hypothetical protein